MTTRKLTAKQKKANAAERRKQARAEKLAATHLPASSTAQDRADVSANRRVDRVTDSEERRSGPRGRVDRVIDTEVHESGPRFGSTEGGALLGGVEYAGNDRPASYGGCKWVAEKVNEEAARIEAAHVSNRPFALFLYSVAAALLAFGKNNTAVARVEVLNARKAADVAFAADADGVADLSLTGGA